MSTSNDTTKKNLEELQNLVAQRTELAGQLAYLRATAHIPGQLFSQKYLYFIACGDLIKIGVSNSPDARLETLQTGAPGKLELIASIPKSGHHETEAHKRFDHLRVYGEWFRYTSEIDAFIQELKNEISNT